MPEASKGETREKVAEKVGMKARTYQKAAAAGAALNTVRKVKAALDDLAAGK